MFKKSSYFIEFRFQGYAKKYSKRVIWNVSKKFKVKGVTGKRVVPHISLYGPFTTTREKLMVSTFVDALSKYQLVPFRVKGFNYFNNTTNKVIYLDIEPSERLVSLRRDLAKKLLRVTSTKSTFDDKRTFYFHSTIAFKDIDRKFKQVWDYISQQRPKQINQHLLRVTIIKNGKILCEYDLMHGKLLNRRQAKSRRIFQQTISILKSKEINFEEEFDPELSLWEKIKNFFDFN